MQKGILFIFFLVISLMSFAQTERSGNILLKGYIRDSATGSPLEKATIRLAALQPSQALMQTVSGIEGAFSFRDVTPGEYVLTVEFVGYLPYDRNMLLKVQDSAIVMETVMMRNSGKTLDAVVVTGTRLLVENKIDRLVYNVDKDVTSQGGMATDVLRKVPQVSVDINGNVELLGNPSVRFLINGKPSAIFGNSIADALQSIPASEIQSIEVMSSPGAKYDATGTGGVINIILKKNKSRGFSGSVNGTAGTRQENGSLNLNYKQNNVAVSGYFSGSEQVKVKTLSEGIRNAVDTATGNSYLFDQQGSSDFKRHGFRSGLGLDWDITPKNNLSFSIGYNNFGNANLGNIGQYTAEYDPAGSKGSEQRSTRLADTRFTNSTLDLGAEYRRKFRREKQELTFSINYSAGGNNTFYLQTQRYLVNDSIFGGSTSENPGKDRLSTLALDYSFPVAKRLLLETGLKVESESLVSDANVYTFSPQQYGNVFDDKQSYTSVFRRDVYAGYVSGTFTLFNYVNVIAGTRWEYTVNKADYSNAHNTSIPDYSNFGPSVTFSHSFNEQQTLRFSYVYRLERPEYRDLNPFVNLSDPHNITTGNAFIKPEIGNDFQLGYNRSLGGDNYINMTLLYNYNSPDIKSYTIFYPVYQVGDSLYNNVNVTRRSNIASEKRWGVNISGAFNAGSKLSIRPNVQLYIRQTNNIYSIPERVSGFEHRLNLNVNYQFNKGLVAEAFGNYRSGTRWQGRQPSFASYTFAVRKQLFKGKGSLGVVAVNAFAKYLTQKSIQEGSGFTATTWLHIPYRSLGVNFMYKFGRMKITKSKEEENFLTRPPVEN